MTRPSCIELVPPSLGPGKAGIILHGECSKIPLWFGEATYSQVYEAVGGLWTAEDDEPDEGGVTEAEFGPMLGYPLWGMYGDGYTSSHIYYFDDQNLFQGIKLRPILTMAVQVGELRMEPYVLLSRESELQYPTFDGLVVKVCKYLQEILKGERVLTQYRGILLNEGLSFSAGSENLDLVSSLGLYSLESLNIVMEEEHWSEILQKRAERHRELACSIDPF